jgi:hypothetical protein
MIGKDRRESIVSAHETCSPVSLQSFPKINVVFAPAIYFRAKKNRSGIGIQNGLQLNSDKHYCSP